MTNKRLRKTEKERANRTKTRVKILLLSVLRWFTGSLVHAFRTAVVLYPANVGKCIEVEGRVWGKNLFGLVFLFVFLIRFIYPAVNETRERGMQME